MSTVQIDRLLDTVIRQNASDLHLGVGRKPTLRLHGRLSRGRRLACLWEDRELDLAEPRTLKLVLDQAQVVVSERRSKKLGRVLRDGRPQHVVDEPGFLVPALCKRVLHG